jgi:hypothetical protein
MLTEIKLHGSTLADGSATFTSDVNVKGLFHAVEWIDGTFDNGVDAVLSLVRNNDAANITLLTLSNADNDVVYMPRYPTHTPAGAENAIADDMPTLDRHFVNGTFSLVIANGGNVKTGGCIVYVEV